MLLNLAAIAFFGSTFAYFGWHLVADYRIETGTRVQRIWAACQKSATMVYAKAYLIVTSGIGLLANLTADAGWPGVSDQIRTVLGGHANWVLAFSVFSFILVYVARNRTAGK